MDKYELSTHLRASARKQLNLDEGMYWDSAVPDAQAKALLDAGYVIVHESEMKEPSPYYKALKSYIKHVEECDGDETFLEAHWRNEQTMSQEDWDLLQTVTCDISMEGLED